ncbi:MAG: RNA polymerase sigma factor [Planctomycetes bacterium]|nr:RNA polymerase sigma factor [Planctomycetota bacterium]
MNRWASRIINFAECGTGLLTKGVDTDEPDFAALSARVYRLCLALLGDEDRARDAAQEALQRAWARRRRKRRKVSWWVWSAGFAVRVCREVRRRAAAGASIRSVEGQDLPDRGQPSNAAGTDHEKLRMAIAELPDRQREVTVLRFLIGLSTQEAADTLRCPGGTVKSNLHKAIANLNAKMTAGETNDEMR